MWQGKNRFVRICFKASVVFALLCSVALADYFAFPFIGKWQPSDDPLLLEDYGLTQIQNLRRSGKGLVPVGGHTAITTTPLYSTYDFPINMYQYSRSNPDKSYIMAQAGTSYSSTSGVLLRNSAAVPATGDFYAASLFTDSAGAGVGRMATGPQGVLAYANGVDLKVWPGGECNILAVYLQNATVALDISTIIKNVTSQLTNNLSTADNVATWDSATAGYILVGSAYKLSGVNIYRTTTNISNVDAAYYLDHSTHAWATISPRTTSATGSPVTVSWVEQGAALDEEPYIIYGRQFYWYLFHAAASSDTIYHVTGVPWVQDVTNIWDGNLISPSRVFLYTAASSAFSDYTLQTAVVGDGLELDLSSAPTTSYVVVGFPVPVDALYTEMTQLKSNADTSTGTVSYWTGSAWASTTYQTGVIADTKALASNGFSTWTKLPKYSQVPRNINNTGVYKTSGDESYYYYKISWDVALDASTAVDLIRGVAQPSPVGIYRFPILFRNRLWLFDEVGNERNKAIYSSYNTSYIFDAEDASSVHFGSNSPVVAAAPLYNVFQTTGYDQLLVMKSNETYRVVPLESDAAYEVQLMSSNIGCVAPLSVATCSAAQIENDGRERQVVIWQSSSGIVMSDGATIKEISNDIRKYWDSNNAAYIPIARQSRSVGWYDPNLQAYKLLITAGDESGGTTMHNIELEYSLKYNEWTRIERTDTAGDPDQLQIGGGVTDAYGRFYSYGFDKEGKMLRLENGDKWITHSIEKYAVTGDLMLDKTAPFFKDTRIDWIRLMFEDQTAASTATWSHWGDGTLTVDGTDDQALPEDVDLTDGPVYTEDCTLGPFHRHRLKISSTGNLKLTGMGLVFESFDAITQ